MVMNPPDDSILYTPHGATPIEPDDLQFLLQPISTRAQLNEVEQRNIFNAKVTARRSRNLRKNLISVDSLIKLHFLMFNEIWTWAGKFRTRITNIGVEPYQIRNQLAALIGNANYWIENNTFPLEEPAIRFHHELVKIHLFPNGNGRHSRLVADLMMFYNKKPEFIWGNRSIDVEGETRDQYLVALEKADRGNYDDLVRFATGKVALLSPGKKELSVLNDTNFPGWTARVDGHPASILPVNFLFRGVALASGTHIVEFEYDPVSFKLGVYDQ